jgi:hypothetical protein
LDWHRAQTITGFVVYIYISINGGPTAYPGSSPVLPDDGDWYIAQRVSEAKASIRPPKDANIAFCVAMIDEESDITQGGAVTWITY